MRTWVLCIVALSVAASVHAQDVVTLTVGTPAADEIFDQFGERYFEVSPGAGQHLIGVWEKPTGFASRLDIKFKALPTDTDNDDSDGGERDGSDQAVEIRTTKAGDYFVRVRAECCDQGGDYTLTAHSLATLPSLSSGVPLLNDLPDQLAAHYYRVTTPAGARLSV